MEEGQTRFKSLIEPIKDLAANWDIDIAEGLSEYLDELESVRISLDGGTTQLNFAEAALLIQGSTAIYSRKVEYLHQLVLKSLEFITSKKSKKDSSNGNKKGTDDGSNSNSNTNKSIEEELLLEFGNDPSYLLLDNVIEEGQNIDLRVTEGSFAKRQSLDASTSAFAASNLSRVSLMQSLLGDQRGGSTALKLTSSFLDPNGALLIPGISRVSLHKPPSEALERSLQNVSAIDGGMVFDAGWQEGPEDFQMDVDDSPMLLETSADRVSVPVIPPLVAGSGEDRITVMSTTSAAALPMGPNALQSQPQPRQQLLPQPQQLQQLNPHALEGYSRPARRGRPYRIPSLLLQQQDNDEDDHDNNNKEANRLRTERFFFEQQQLAQSHHSKQRDSWSGFLNASIPCNGLSDVCLLPLLKLKRKMHRKRVAHHSATNFAINNVERMATGSSTDQFMNENDDDRNLAVHSLWAQPQPLLDAHSQPLSATTTNNNTADGMSGPSDHVYYDDAPDPFDVEDDVGAPFDDLPLHFQSSMGDARPAAHGMNGSSSSGAPNMAFAAIANEEELARRVDAALQADLPWVMGGSHSYEKICQQYIDGFHRGANAFARESQLSKRVSDWTLRLEPILQAQEDATPYDIQDYAQRVLEKMDSVLHKEHPQDEDDAECSRSMAFSEVVQGQSSAEVCRVFLACLQLANLGNVVLGPDALPLSHAVESTAVSDVQRDFAVQLVTTHKQQDIHGFSAPSASQTASSEGLSHMSAPSVSSKENTLNDVAQSQTEVTKFKTQRRAKERRTKLAPIQDL